MKPAKALKLVTEACEFYMQKRLHVDANLYDILKIENPTTLSASKQRSELREALSMLKELVNKQA